MTSPTTNAFDATKSINAGYLKKNRTPPNAGRGRPRGSKNVVSRTMREMIEEFLQHNFHKVQGLYDRVAKKDPVKALQLYTNLLDFGVSRMARVDVVQHNTQPITAAPINDPTEAASIYAAVLGNTKIDLNIITFAASPKPDNVVAVQAQQPPKAPVREMVPTSAASSKLIRTAEGPSDKVVSLHERLGK